MRFAIEFSGRARDNLKSLRKRDQQVVVDAIEGHLAYEPGKPARNRKLVEDNPLAPWELRVGDSRVFYDVNVAEATVVVVAVGHKVHNRLRIGGEEIEL
jgi:mRNA-degrading endonuclease RelE of RelBE toxin-antitoxin system